MDKNINEKVVVSIILPTLNGGSWIFSSIKSVIDQTFSDWELIIISDGSTDNTENVVKSFNDDRIIYLKNENNLGIQKTLNKGLKKARGKYIARIDDDDKWIDKDKLEKQVEFLDNNPDHVLIGSGVVVLNEKEEELFRYLLPDTDKKIRNRLLSKNCFVHSAVMFRKQAVDKLGGYSEDFRVKHLEDYDLWLRLGTVGKLANLPRYAVSFMSRDTSISSVNKIKIFKKIIGLISKYKNLYPNYYLAFIRAIIRLIVYGIFIKSPIKFSLNKIIKIYKEF